MTTNESAIVNDAQRPSTTNITKAPVTPVVINLWVAGNIPMGREYFVKITLFFILDEP
jgi:hypothetical protein